MKRIIVNALIGLFFTSSHSFAQEYQPAHENGGATKSMTEIMLEMNANLNKLTRSILLENYPMIVSSSYDIANHPGIAQEDLQNLFKRLGSRKKAFIACDTAVHHLANEVSKAGEQRNMDLVLEKYSAMLSKAVECHREYRIK